MSELGSASLYEDLRRQQRETLEILNPANQELKRLQRVKKELNLKDNPKELQAWKAEFRDKKDYQLSVVDKLNQINAQLKVVRKEINEERDDERLKKLEERRIKKSTLTLPSSRKRCPGEKSTKIDEEREERKEKQALAREREQKPSRGYTFPLLSDAVRETSMYLDKNVFSVLERQRRAARDEEKNDDQSDNEGKKDEDEQSTRGITGRDHSNLSA